MSIVLLRPATETLPDPNLREFRVGCDTQTCTVWIEASGAWTHDARRAARRAGWSSRKGSGPGSGIYRSTDHCPKHSATDGIRRPTSRRS